MHPVSSAISASRRGLVRIGYADAERVAGRLMARAGDIAGRVHQRAVHLQTVQCSQRALSRPPFDISGGVEPSWHRPRVEPATGQSPCHLTRAHDRSHLRRGLVSGDLAAAKATDRAVRSPGAEYLVSTLEHDRGMVDPAAQVRGPRLVSRWLAEHVDRDDCAHDMHEMTDRCG